MKSKNVEPLDDRSFPSILAAEGTVLLDFTATWCGPCKVLAPVVESIADETVGTLRVAAVDMDASPATCAKLGVRAAPTIIVLRGGKEVARHVGVTTKKRLLELAGLAGLALTPRTVRLSSRAGARTSGSWRPFPSSTRGSSTRRPPSRRTRCSRRCDGGRARRRRPRSRSR